ncbi:MAG: hypothetical protein AB7U23_12665 [Dehalococcoidia bacterium]
MTKARHIAVMNYLIAEGGLPYVRPVDRSVFGQPEGTALALPPPFESAVVVGVVRYGLRAWLVDPRRKRGRLLIHRQRHEHHLDDLVVEMTLRDLAALLRPLYMKEDP